MICDHALQLSILVILWNS